MPNRNVLYINGSESCFRFEDGTPPVCNAERQLGHFCRKCRREAEWAEDIFRSETPRARRLLLQREHRNLQLVKTFADLELRAETSATEAWRAAVAAKMAEWNQLREMLQQDHQQ